MNSPATAADAANCILEVFDRHGCRPGDVLRINSFLMPFGQPGWRGSDFKPGMELAIDQGWAKVLPGGDAFRLTETGHAAIEDGRKMNLLSRCNESVTIERKNGTRFESVRALVTEKMVMIPDSKIPVAIDDVILRELPSGIVERLVVTSPGFHAAALSFPPHYQIKYRHEGKKPSGTPGYVIHASNNSHVNINSTDNSVNQVDNSNKDLSTLADQLAELRSSLAKKAESPEHYVTLGAISSAEIAAKAGSGSGVSKAMSTLGAGAKWALDTAKEIGVSVAADTLKSYIGLPPS